MAIEIKRTPVLKGDASRVFIQSLNRTTPPTRVSTEQVRNAIEVSKRIMVAFKAKVK